jgi:hypothetical protein
MSGYRSEASSRSAVKNELTSAHLEYSLISPASGLHAALSVAVRPKGGQRDHTTAWMPPLVPDL